jgi:hypothetical protein
MTEPRGAGRYSQTITPEEVISEALGVYDPSGRSRLDDASADLVSAARAALPAGDLSLIAPAIERVSRPVDPAALGPAERDALVDDIYLLRAAAIDPEKTVSLLHAREYLASVHIPEEATELRLDRAVAEEQLSFATIVRDPGRVPPMLRAIESFLRSYRASYIARHGRYWAETAGVHARLLEAEPRAAALARLNSLTEMGPPVGEMALEAIGELARESAGCEENDALDEALRESPVCPGCALRLGQAAPAEAAAELLSRLDRALERQMSRLSSVAVRGLLERSDDPRIARFLRIVNASQLSSLVAIMDDQLTNYLRRFLLESRIHEILDPIFERVERGEAAGAQDTDRLREMAALLERALRASQRELPPG